MCTILLTFSCSLMAGCLPAIIALHCIQHIAERKGNKEKLNVAAATEQQERYSGAEAQQQGVVIIIYYIISSTTATITITSNNSNSISSFILAGLVQFQSVSVPSTLLHSYT